MTDVTTVTVLVEDALVKEGAKDGKPWKKIGLKDANGEFYSTFDTVLGDKVVAAKGTRATISWRPSKNPAFKDLLSLEPVEESSLPSSQAADGTADWDLIGLRKTRCLLWAHYFGSPLAAHVAGRTLEGGSPSFDVYRFGCSLIAAAERDIYYRETTDGSEDVPF